MSDDRLDKLDYYTLLQVDREASVDDVKRAFHAFALRYHPDTHVGGSDEKRRRATQIYRRGAEAYEVLLDAERRALYDLQLSHGHLRYDEDVAKKLAEPPPEPPKQYMFRTQEGKDLTQRAQRAYKEGRGDEALRLLEEAKFHEPDNPLILEFIDQLRNALYGL